MPHGVIGWDVGGVNTKVARVEGGVVRALRSIPYEIQRAPGELAPLIARLAREVGSEPHSRHAVTMTAELSQYFRTKREGVGFVLDAFESALPGCTIMVYGTDGIFRNVDQARCEPLLSAASNWVATAAVVALKWRNAVLVDIGSTTTDIVPVRDGEVVARGRTDPERLRTGELLYLGAVRTPIEAIVHEVPLGAAGVAPGFAAEGRSSADPSVPDGMAGVSAESFALAGDVYLWLGDIGEDEYTVRTPDGRPATRAGARDRLARVVCADGEMLDDAAIDAIARHVARVQAERVAWSLERVYTHHSISTVVTAGIGSFIARRAAALAGLAAQELGAELGTSAGRSAPAAAVAILLERLASARKPEPQLSSPTLPSLSSPRKRGPMLAGVNMGPRFRGDDKARGDDGESSAGKRELNHRDPDSAPDSTPTARPLAPRGTVVKVGGALLGRPGALDIVVSVLAAAARRGDPLLVVPGGGPFADAVRRIDSEIGLSDDAAHWMAILALDQYAELLASRIERSRIVRGPTEVSAALAAGELPILAPSRWLRSADPLPLPHSWDVTSDSIAAWVAGELGATRLVLAKAARVDVGALVDPHFARALPQGVEALVVEPSELGDALSVLRAPPE